MSYISKYKPVRILPFLLNNIEDFIADKTKFVYHPYSNQYDRYWNELTAKAIYGVWGQDVAEKNGVRIGGWRWLPGGMYMHVNHLPIMLEDESGKSRGTAVATLRDNEWLIGYDLIVCDGFSGMDGDKNITCFEPILKIEKGIPLTPSEEILLKRNEPFLINKAGKYKKYMDAREYLYQTFDEPMGNPLWANESYNYMLASTRRLGKSYAIINAEAAYKFIFGGAKTVDDYYNERTATTQVIGSGNSDKSKEFCRKLEASYEYLRTNVGAFNDGSISENGAWWKKTVGKISSKENTSMTNAVPIEGGVGVIGPGCLINHVSYQRSASKGAGYATDNNIVEEFGLTPKLQDIHRENSPAQESDYKFGKGIYIGTGGDFDIVEESKPMFYNPVSFRILPCKDLFLNYLNPTARFVPSYYYKNQFRDENGNQDIEKAFKQEMLALEEKRKGTTLQYLGHKSSYPTVHTDIFLKFDGNRFPVQNLEDRKTKLEQGEIPYQIVDINYINALNTEASWSENFTDRPFLSVEELGSDKNKEGSIIMYEPPMSDRPKRKYADKDPMYLLLADLVRNDIGTSFVHGFIWKFSDFKNPSAVQQNVVMEWFGRFADGDKNFDRLFKMAALYGCNIYPEINNDEIKRFARRTKRYDWLIPDLGNIEGLEAKTTDRHEVGFYVSPGMTPGLESLSDQQLRTVVAREESIIGREYISKEIIVADTLNSAMMCSQFINYTRSGNFDAVSSFHLLSLWKAANMMVEEQFTDKEGDKKMKEALQAYRKSINLRRRTNLRDRKKEMFKQ